MWIYNHHKPVINFSEKRKWICKKKIIVNFLVYIYELPAKDKLTLMKKFVPATTWDL